MGKTRHSIAKTAGMVLVAITVFALIGVAVYFGLDAFGRISPVTTPPTTSTSGTGLPTASPETTKAAIIGQSENQLIQHLIEMILNDARFDELFAQIPVDQRPDIDKDTFYQYVSLLRGGIRGRITAFVPIVDTEIQAIRQEILENSPRYSYLTEHLTGYWILYQPTIGSQERFAVYLHRQADGMALFLDEWIDGVLALQSYATLYFDAVEKGNADALSVLVFSEVNDSSIRTAKANTIIRFYQQCVPMKSSGFRLLFARADSFGYEQSAIDYTRYLTYRPHLEASPASTITPSPDPVTPTPLPVPDYTATREVRIVKTGLDQMKVVDPIPHNLSYQDVTVNLNGEPILTLGEYVFSFELNTRFGSRIAYECFPASGPFNPELQIIKAYYPGATVTLVGTCDSRLQAFQGHVYSIEFRSLDYRTGSGMAIGESRKAVLLHYPFADMTSWAAVLPTVFDRIDFGIVNGNLTNIRISRQAEALEKAIQAAEILTPTPTMAAFAMLLP